MKIVSGLGSIDDYRILAEAGADEFFCGYVPYRWVKKYGVLSPLNRREVLYYNVQISSFGDLKILRRMIEDYQVPVKITLNSLYYTKEQYPMVEELIKECMDCGFDTFIIADPALIYHLRNRQIPCIIHLSGEMAEVNRNMISLMNEFEIRRYIFHRKNTIEDMTSCIQNNKKQTEYEAFIMNELCHFSGAFCNSLHCDELTHLCKVSYELARVTSKKIPEQILTMNREEYEEVLSINEYAVGSTGCGLCAIRRLAAAGITHLKLVGRGNHPEWMRQDIIVLKKTIKLARSCGSEADFVHGIRRNLLKKSCSRRCYYL